MDKMDEIKKPKHYQHQTGIECKDITRHLSFTEGNIFKYIFRAGEKDCACKDFAKALEYCKMLIETPVKGGIKGVIIRYLTAKQRALIISKIKVLYIHELCKYKKNMYGFIIQYLTYNNHTSIMLLTIELENKLLEVRFKSSNQ